MNPNIKGFISHIRDIIENTDSIRLLGLMYIMNSRDQSKVGPQGKVRDIMKAYEQITRITKEEGYDYIIGDKVPSVNDLCERFRDVVYEREMSKKNFATREYDKDRIADGYVDSKMIAEIYCYWQKPSKKKIISAVYGKEDSGLPLNGERSYFFSDPLLQSMVFSYFYHGEGGDFKWHDVYTGNLLNEELSYYKRVLNRMKGWEEIDVNDINECLDAWELAHQNKAEERYKSALGKLKNAALSHPSLADKISEIEKLEL